jgi:hypothetical protein
MMSGPTLLPLFTFIQNLKSHQSPSSYPPSRKTPGGWNISFLAPENWVKANKTYARETREKQELGKQTCLILQN